MSLPNPLNSQLKRAYKDGAEGVASFIMVKGDEIAEILYSQGDREGANEIARQAHELRHDTL